MLTQLFNQFTPYEWILANRKGGYALGSAFLGNYRKYHGLLIAGKENGKRVHLVSNIEEKVIFPSGLEYFLDSNFYKDTIYPEGYKLIKQFFYQPYPKFYYACLEKGDFFLKKSIRMDESKNILLVSYKNISSYPFKLFLRPKLSFRDHHQVGYASSWEKSFTNIEIYEDSALVIKEEESLFTYISKGSIFEEPLFYYQVYYPLEAIRGYPAYEDLFSPFLIEVELSGGETFHLIFSEVILKDFKAKVKEIENRYKGYPELKLKKKAKFSYEDYLKVLELGLRNFLLEKDVIAGFPWFYTWGRDTFIGLPALFYLEEGLDFCLKIFKHYQALLKDGLIPNVAGPKEEINYNSVDATLWYALRVFQYLEFFKEKVSSSQRKELLDTVELIIREILTNPLLPFRVDLEDGLIEIPETTGLALTWMDVMIDGIPITPRYGKPIEISALWFNVLSLAQRYLDKKFPVNLKSLVEKQSLALKGYFNGELWADRIYQGNPIFEIRPNFVIALSLPVNFADTFALEKAWEITQRELLTPYGLRSLSPRHPNFRRKYFGTQYMRDLAYHNGTVWVWLLYPYAELLKKVLPKERLIKELTSLIKIFRELWVSGRLSSIPELYDGENPYYPKGAPAQFWSVAAVFLIEKELEKLKREVT
ncbi:MAG: amylo-alpha-1,6-glucosidase [Thermodesulfobacteriaceae bacterium]|nr:amylo-alpha-1,6-glucosidase [Thermodesulfobacteriaceae bacterium]